MKIKYLLSVSFLLAHLFVIAQSPSISPNWSSQSLFEHKVFIENKGQYDWVDNGSGNNTLYGASFCDIDVHFSGIGLTYVKTELRSMKTEETRNEGSRKKEKSFLKVPHYVYLEWVGANKNAKVVAEDLESHYFTYASLDYRSGKESLKASAYKKIVYKDLYPGIDVEYSFPDGKPGIKYTIILHPGADPSLLKMRYSGEKNMSLDGEGNVVVEIFGTTIIDHAPVSFFELDNEPVESAFRIQGDTISFSLPSYDRSKTLVIDPWTVVPAFVGYNAAYDVEYDFQGNVYVYGGEGQTANPFQEIKYNSAGVMQWVYTWATAINTTSYGDFTVDGASGSSYIVQGFTQAIPIMVKVNAAGAQAAIFSNNTWMNEMWRIEYNNCTKKMIIAGGGTTGTTNQAATIDTNLTAMTGYNVLGAVTDLHDICLMAIDNSGDYYMASARSQMYPSVLDNVFLKGPASTILPVAYTLPNNHAFIEVGSIGYINNSGVSPTALANGFNGMGVSSKYLYTYDGSIIKRWNKLTGAFINSAVLSPTKFNWGGLAVDDCDNIFVGVQQSVLQLDTNFNTITTAAVPNTVYDVVLGPGNLMYACGKQFLSSFNVTLSPCNSFSASVSSTGSCATGSATVTVTGGSGPYSYSWNPTGQTTQVATSLATGNYTVTVFDNSCSPSAQTATVAVTAGALLNSVTSTPAVCLVNDGTATATPSGGTLPYTYQWSPAGGTNAVATGLAAGTYTVIITDGTGCTGTSTVNIASVGGASVSVNQTNVLCNGSSTGTATLTVSGGTAPYTYSWSPSGGSSSAATGLGVGSYSILITDANGCTQSQSLTITQPLALTATASATQALCSSNNGTATVNPTGGTGAYTYLWMPAGGSSSIATGLTAGSYTATVTDANGCSQSAVALVTSIGGPTANAGIDASIVAGGSTMLSGSGGGTYNWSPAIGLSCITCSNPLATPSVTTTYTLMVADSSGCTDIAIVTVFVEPIPCGTKANAGSFYLPSAFSPNDDGENDELCLLGWDDCLKEFSIQIYSRWGELVFESEDKAFCWDGTFRSRKLNSEVFAYVIKAELYDGVIKDVKGNISLIR